MKPCTSPPEIAARIHSLGLTGFGSACFDAARTINRKVFCGRGTIVGAANAFWLKRGRFLGHVAVEFGSIYWDVDARPKLWEDIKSWGMLDEEDSDYFAPGWNVTAAYKVKRLQGEKAVQETFGGEKCPVTQP